MSIVAGLIIGGITTAYGLYQSYKSQQALEEMEKEERAEYKVSPEMQRAYQRAEETAKTGYTPEETAAFRQQLATSGATAYQRSVDIGGGGMAQTMRAGIQAQNIGAISQFAAGGAARRQQNIRYADAIAARMQSIQNLQTREDIARRTRTEEAYGAAGKAGAENIIGGISTGVGLAAGAIGEDTTQPVTESAPGGIASGAFSQASLGYESGIGGETLMKKLNPATGQVQYYNPTTQQYY